MKYFIVKKGENYFRIGCHGFTPVGYDEFMNCPDDAEDVSDVDIVEEEDSLGISRKIVKFNAVKKQARLDAEQAAKDAQEAADLAEDNTRQMIKNRINDYKQNIEDAVSTSEIKAVLVNLAEDLGRLANRVL